MRTLELRIPPAAIALAAAVAFVPRRRSPAQIAALGAAVLIALQLGMTYWFYLYVVWFAPFVLISLFTEHAGPNPGTPTTPANERTEAQMQPVA